MDELKGEMNKIKPPNFDGEKNKDEDDETWLLGMRKYFQLQNYSSHAEGIISIYQLKGKASERKMLLGRNSRNTLKINI